MRSYESIFHLKMSEPITTATILSCLFLYSNNPLLHGIVYRRNEIEAILFKYCTNNFIWSYVKFSLGHLIEHNKHCLLNNKNIQKRRHTQFGILCKKSFVNGFNVKSEIKSCVFKLKVYNIFSLFSFSVDFKEQEIFF